ncbi:MAG: ATP-binding protein [bacterium]
MKETELFKKLLEASNSSPNKILPSLLNAVSDVFSCKLSSLWKLNNLSKTLSVYARINYYPPPEKAEEYVHSLEGSLIGYLIKQNNKKYFDIPSVLVEPYWGYHKSKKRVIDLELKRLICIPIPNLDNKGNDEYDIDAVLNIYVNDNIAFYDSYAEIIRDQFSIAISRARLFSRENLTRDIIQVYEQKGSKDFSSIIHPIINRVFKNYLSYEGSSFFIWDPFFNRFALSQTTGLVNKPKKSDVFYSVSEGLTGRIAELKKIFIVKDLMNIEDDNFKSEYIHKWQEETAHTGKTFMGIPIMSPSMPQEIIGILRFTNRLNPLAPVIDCFSKEDCDLVNYACNLIALYLEFEQGEKKQTAFAKQMAHEMLAPAVAIRGSADRLLRKWQTKYFTSLQIDEYLRDILEHVSLQVTLTRSVEYMKKGSSDVSKSERYQVNKYDLEKDVLKPCRKLIIPIARNEGLKFDNIIIDGNYPSLFIDNYAFEQVFFNLFNNAIKYRRMGYPQDFKVVVKGEALGEYQVPEDNNHNTNPINKITKKGYLITIEDYGVGIKTEEKDKIFLFGYRMKGIEKTNVRGLGLGLTIIKGILDDFYCTIWVDNLVNPTRFNIFIPETLKNSSYILEPEWKSR